MKTKEKNEKKTQHGESAERQNDKKHLNIPDPVPDFSN
jgi:hypothetical protein